MLAPDARSSSQDAYGGDLSAQTAPAEKSLLRFLTCGSVDDGKSTLIGRLLYESGAVFDDQLAALESDSKRHGTDGANLDFALLVDGLSAEREQGITIDVAYRYFSTPRRAFIVADTPGHEQYTRNMATGASTADLAVLLVDARKGLLVQTRRHAMIASLLRVPHVVLAVNKMDLIDFDQKKFIKMEKDFRAAVAGLDFKSITAIPVCARNGDNVIKHSEAMPWFSGAPLLNYLEQVEIGDPDEEGAAASNRFVFPVQWVNRPDATFRGFSGTIATGSVAAGDTATVYPGGQSCCISRIVGTDGDLSRARAGQAVTLVLDRDIDISRGDVIASSAGQGLQVTRGVKAHVFWTNALPAQEGHTYIMQAAGAQTQVRLETIHYGLAIDTFAHIPMQKITMNTVALVSLDCSKPVTIANYRDNQALGSLVLIDRYSNDTVAIGLIDGQADTGVSPAGKETVSLIAPGLASLKSRFERSAGVAGSIQRSKWSYRVSWRLLSAMLVAVVAGGVAESFAVALFAGSADLLIRPLMHRWHRLFWRKGGSDDDLNLDGGGI